MASGSPAGPRLGERPINSNEEPETEQAFEDLIALAKAGDRGAIGTLMSQYRSYLLLIANEELDPGIQAKLGPSDIVQQTMIAAHGHIEQFRGETEAEFRGWLRKILKNDLADATRHFRSVKRRKIDLEKRIDDSRQIQPPIHDRFNTPGTDALVNEQAELLKNSMDQLPENYRQVVQLRNWEELSFAEIGERMDCSADAARKLWYRAVVRLEQEFAKQHPGGASSILANLPGKGESNRGESNRGESNGKQP